MTPCARRTRRRIVVARAVAVTLTVAVACQTPDAGPRPTAGPTPPPAGPHSAESSAAPDPGAPAAAIESGELAAHLARGRSVVEGYFGTPFRETFEVRVFARRDELTEFARARWGMPQTDCWMVAMGVSSVLVLLSPDAWKSDACEHDPNPSHVREIITHELVHVYHGQHNASHEFEGMDEAGWFVEGLAVHVAGQLSAERLARLRTALADGRGPTRLADAWSGEHRYAISGSLVAFVEQRWGRGMILRLLASTDNSQILATLGLREDELLAAWRSAVGAAG